MFRTPASRLSLLAFVAIAGCATVPEKVPDVKIDDANAEVPLGESSAPEPAPVPSDSTVTNLVSPVVPAPPTSAPRRAKPWKCSFTVGRNIATVDGVSVYLGEPAVRGKTGDEAAPSARDSKSTIGPLLSARKTPLVFGRKMRICIDPGHGGIDSGAVSRDGKTEEKKVALDIALRVARKLRADGFDVMLTRTNDATAVELSERADAARRWRADAFVSIHINSAESKAARGLETYAMTPQGMESTSHSGASSADSKVRFPGNASDEGNIQLAFSIHRRLVRAAGASMVDRGLRRARWIVLREARCPAALVECGFVSSNSDLAWLRSERGRETTACGIYEGICDFAFGTMEPGLPARKPPKPNGKPKPPAQTIQQSGSVSQSPRAFLPVQNNAPAASLERVSAPLPERPLDSAPGVSAARAAALRAAGLAPVGSETDAKEDMHK